MTYEELIANPDFIGFCEKWKADRWCPAPLVDWLLERGMDLQAEAARWAVNTEEREDLFSDKKSRPCPQNKYSVQMYTFDPALFHLCKKTYYDDMPIDKFIEQKTFHECIADYLFNFDPELAEKYPPKECIV